MVVDDAGTMYLSTKVGVRRVRADGEVEPILDDSPMPRDRTLSHVPGLRT